MATIIHMPQVSSGMVRPTAMLSLPLRSATLSSAAWADALRLLLTAALLMLSYVASTPLLMAQTAEPIDRGIFLTTNLNTSQGLSSSRAYSVLQGSDGAMWIATKMGVDRYNGHTVRHYQLSESKSLGDAGGMVVKLFSDSRGDIYTYDNKGHIYVYSDVLDSFLLIHNLVAHLGATMVVNEVCTDASGQMWAALDRGLCRIDGRGNARLIIKGKYIFHVGMMPRGVLAGTTEGLFAVEGMHVRKVLDQRSVLSSLVDAAHGILWLGTFHDGVQAYSIDTFSPIHMPGMQSLPLMPVRSVISWNQRTVLFGLDGAGIYSYDTVAKQLSELLDTDGRPDNSLQGNGVYSMLRDRNGNLWTTSYSGGADLAVPIGHTFDFVRREYLNRQSILNNSVNDIMQSRDGRLWFATDYGVSIYDGGSDRWTHTLYNKVVLSLCEQKSGYVAAATYGDGVFAVSADGRSTLLYSTHLGNLKSNYVYSVLLDSHDALWIGCLDGPLTAVSGKTRREFPIDEVLCLAESPDGGAVAVGTTHGGYLIDETSGRVSRFFYPEEFVGADNNYYINAMLFDSTESLWLGTDGGGVYNYDFRSRRVRRITTDEGLPSNVVSSLVLSRDRQLWMGTDRGLACLRGNVVYNINYMRGLECEYRRMAADIIHDGRLVFGNNDGAVVVQPDSAIAISYRAPLHITGIDVEGVSADSLWQTRLHRMISDRKLRLAHDNNTVTIHFESINYRYLHDIEYQCQLEGFDQRWNVLLSRQEARYANLPPGDYVFRVKSVSKSSHHVLGEDMISITISHPWWNTLWAWIAYISFMLVLAYMGWDYYRGRLRQRYDRDKIDFFVNTAHNIRTPLTLALAPLKDVAADTGLSARSREFLTMAQENGNRLMTMISELLDFQKAEQGARKFHPQLLSLSMWAEGQTAKFALMAHERGIALRTLLPEEDVAFISDRTILDLIAENLISNTLKYTPEGGTVTIAGHEDGAHVYIDVIDTGIGIPDADKAHIFSSYFRASNTKRGTGHGLGLKITRQLVARLGGTLSWTSEEDKGTTFTIMLPMPKEQRRRQPEKNVQTGQHSDTILFVDDNNDLRQYMRMAFSADYNVVTVASGEEALKFLEDGLCDIVVSDIMMPGIQGDELCRRIKENDDTAWLPVILLTAKGSKDFIIDGLRKGADDYIAKPFDTDILAGKIEAILANRRRLGRYYLSHSMAQAHEVGAREGMQPACDEAQTAAPAGDIALDERDREFVDRATALVLDNISDTDFSIDSLCQEMAMSRTLFYGRLKSLTGQTPQDFIRLLRLERAAALLRQGVPVLDVSVRTGFVNAKYFSTVFKKHFGVSPSKYNA